ncbi:MAG: type I methionyl aminopeptidase [Crocinitomicaceae bacterium]|tara:strand:- start:82 stop:858 length:777 start_codon:yes stop_codon:yes gene_type:complete
MIKYKTEEEIELMRQAALVVSRTLGEIAKVIKPGVTGLQLDKLAEEYIRDQGAVPGFLGLYDFPNTLCISPNEQVVHGFPTDKPYEDGDIVSVDCGAILNGYYGDHAYTFELGDVAPEVRELCRVTKESLYKGIEATNASNRISDIGYAIQQHAEAHGYGVVRELVGHGIGSVMHEDPQIPNYGKRGRGKKIKNGLTIAIEPMINMGTEKIVQLSDGWTILTGDGKPSAHFEHDVAVVDGKPVILSTFDYIEEALGIK